MSEAVKEKLELQKLRQDLRHERIKLYLSIVGALLVLLGLLADRLKTHEQQRHEFELAQLNQRLSRMTAVTEEYDRLFAQTTGVLYRNRTRTWQLTTEIGSLDQELRNAKLKDPETVRLQKYVHEVYTKLADSSVSVDEWADAFALKARWDSLSRSITPDFEHYFGNDLLQPWSKLRDAALAALQAEYSLRGTHPEEKMDEFRQLGAAFQAQLYSRIKEARARQ